MTLGSISRHAWMAALVAVVAASVAMSATAVAGAGKDKPEVTAITVRPIHEAQVVRGDDGKDHVEYDLLVVNVVGDPVTLSSVTVLDRAGNRARPDRRGHARRRHPEPLHPRASARHSLIGCGCGRGRPGPGAGHRAGTGHQPDRVQRAGRHASAVLLDATEGEVDGPKVEVNRRPAIVIKPPLAGDGWLAIDRVLRTQPPPRSSTRHRRSAHRNRGNVRRRLGPAQGKQAL